MRIENQGNGLLTTPDFWDCECDGPDFMRHAENPVCERCGCHAEDCADSRVAEVMDRFFNTNVAIGHPLTLADIAAMPEYATAGKAA